MSKTQIFIEKARAKHGDRYSYENTVYKKWCDKVIISCPSHGKFTQTPNGHLSGRGCRKCAGKHSPTTAEWIARAKIVHGDTFDYLKTVYTGSKETLTITCPTHGDFEQMADNHLKGSGCEKCYGRVIPSTSGWIDKAIAVHGLNYSYDETVYKSSKKKVIIKCQSHGFFKQIARDHLRGSGCPLCPKRYDQPTNLYLMHNGLGKVKVGFSIDAYLRLSQLNRDAPFKAELLETWTMPDTPTARKIEGKIHRKLAKYHAGLSGFDGATEWFNTSPEVAKEVIMKSLA